MESVSLEAASFAVALFVGALFAVSGGSIFVA
ncbi:exported protein of unknown function [Azospirillum baldaniorum]|uniref:Uncharacterized protein n=1 Tax=Azospirillum baldaniorum TaxID=1064539 RepID=A0A9P1JMN3_9PROT|nr:exported protein of unknown function [Azospirillum baldaniorum]